MWLWITISEIQYKIWKISFVNTNSGNLTFSLGWLVKVSGSLFYVLEASVAIPEDFCPDLDQTFQIV
jgi:hypothetical protein